MKIEDWKKRVKHKKHKKFDNSKRKKLAKQEAVPEVPAGFEKFYEDLGDPSAKKGNVFSRPDRFVNELKVKKQKTEAREKKNAELQEKQKKRADEAKKKKRFSRLLSKTNRKGQPKLSNKVLYLFDKLNN